MTKPLKSQISNFKLLVQNRQHSASYFLCGDSFHAAEINWAFAEKTWAAFDVVSQDSVTVTERPGQTWLGRTKMATTGTPSKAARCIVPVSLVSSKRHSRSPSIS